MARKRRGVDVLSVRITTLEDGQDVSFETILNYLSGRKYVSRDTGKLIEIQCRPDPEGGNIVKGVVITTQDSDIPPKRNKMTGQMSAIGINVDVEGLAYANAFLYDINHKVLIYEVNKNGCYIKQLKEMIYELWNAVMDINDHRPKFNIDFFMLARRDEYQRMLRMSYYKQISIELARPHELINNFIGENDSISNWIKANLENAVSGNADTVLLEQTATSRKINIEGLSRNMITNAIDKLFEKVDRSHVSKLIVRGYTEDVEDSSRCRPVDLLTDVFDESFFLNDVAVHSNLQVQERMIGVQSIHNRILPELNAILGQ